MPGPPKLPAETKKLRGTFRPGRDGPEDHAMDDLGTDKVRMPKSLKGDAARLWQRVIPPMRKAGIVRNTDVPIAVEMCRWFAKYRELFKKMNQLDSNPPEFETVDDEVAYERNAALIQRRTDNAWKNFCHAAARLGLTPADRARIRSGFEDGGKGGDNADPLSYFGISKN